MSNKSWMWKVAVGIVIVGVLVAGGFWIYQLGYRSGVAAADTGEAYLRRPFGSFWDGDEDYDMPFGGYHGMFSDEDGDSVIPFYQRSDDLFSRRFYSQDRFPMTWSYFSPLWFVMKLVVFGVFVWFIYKVITLLIGGKGWQLSFTRIEGDDKGKK
ncbi:MAG: hypothetical protein PVF83_08885 [Anaerolineales bacterium]